MSTHKPIDIEGALRKLTVPDIRAHKRRDGAAPLVCLTAYTVLTARLLDAHTDLLLVGDSLGMVLYGLDTTVGVTLDMMILHGQAVMRGAKRSCVIVDMPFGTYQESPQVAFRNAARILKEVGCAGVKIEGGVEMAETVKFLTER
ncbi:MAG: 3-methyl-2-oxobutanoate hydroxymethyltransferase, partial [Alphaproteobacteria bacterium]|nr:3-methyl-2-oxobutanoate hydroxymethyltransferase [Alphaproteobacteria bacterium]